MTTKETLDAVEETLDVIEDTLDLITISSKQYTAAIFSAGVVGLVGGGALAFFFTRRHLKTKYEALVEEEIAEAKEFYRRHYKVGEFESPSDAKEALIGPAAEALSSYQTGAEDGDLVVSRTSVEVTENVFQAHLTEGDWDQEAEESTRNPEEPYVIHHDEYMEGEHSYRQVTLTYFAGDDVLVDDKDTPIEDIDGTVGEGNLTRFGHGSKDNRIVYIRNDRVSMDFEVVMDDDEFAKKVLGLQHSYNGPQIRRMRSADE